MEEERKESGCGKCQCRVYQSSNNKKGGNENESEEQYKLAKKEGILMRV